MENLMKKQETIIENFDETVDKKIDMKELRQLREKFCFDSNDPNGRKKYTDSNNILNNWVSLVRSIDPDCANTRLFHYIQFSSRKIGECIKDDLEGDLSAERFLRANRNERVEIINRLEEQVSRMAESEKISA